MIPLRLALADDQALVRAGLRAVLEQLGYVIAIEADGGEKLIEALQGTEVDVVLSDIRMPLVDGFGVLEALRDGPPVILLTTFDDRDALMRASTLGAKGYMLKDVEPAELSDAIQRVHLGEVLFKPLDTAVLSQHLDADPVLASFSKREIDILRLMAAGYSNREIARTVFLAEGTVKNYISTILEKLGTRDRTRASLKAIALRLI